MAATRENTEIRTAAFRRRLFPGEPRHTRQRRQFAAQARLETRYGGGAPLNINAHPVGRIAHTAAQPFFPGEAIDKRAKAHALNLSHDCQQTAHRPIFFPHCSSRS